MMGQVKAWKSKGKLHVVFYEGLGKGQRRAASLVLDEKKSKERDDAITAKLMELRGKGRVIGEVK